MTKPRVAIVVSHPIQYQAPWFRALADVTDLHVFFCHKQDAAGQAAAGFGVAFDWDVPLLEGYQFSWLRNVSRRPGVSHFAGCDTPEIFERLRAGRFDACIVSGWYLKSYLQALWACRRLGIPVLSRGDSHLDIGRSRLWKAAKYVPYRALLTSFDAHLYVGRANFAYLSHYGVESDRLYFTPHFVDNAFFSTRADEAREGGVSALRRAIGLPADATVFAFVGKLIDAKRPQDFIHALASARRAGVNACGLVVGAGVLQNELTAIASRLGVPVHFAGFQNQTGLPRYFAAADVLVLPSQRNETWGLVVNEAMACGLPAVVSSSVGCGPDLIEAGKTGYIFPNGDVAALGGALQSVAGDLDRDHAGIRTAVLGKIGQYTCENTVRGTLNALEDLRAGLRPAPTNNLDSRPPTPDPRVNLHV